VFVLLLHDVGWITMRPEVGLPALVIGFYLQTCILLRSCGEPGVELANEMAVLFWLVGNNIWTACEYIWEDSKPVGFLSGIKGLSHLERHWYTRLMRVANVIMLGVCVYLLMVYLVRWALFSCRRDAGNSTLEPLFVSVEGHAGDDVGPLPCLPMRVYQEFFIVPWLVMDTGWEYINYRSTLGKHVSRPLLVMSTTAGALAIAVQCDSLRRTWRSGVGGPSEVSIGAAELLWVLGNIVWMLEDVLLESGCFSGRCTSVALFIAGAILAICAMRAGHKNQACRELGSELGAVSVSVRGVAPRPNGEAGEWV